MLKIAVPCSAGGENSQVTVYIDNPEEKHNPIEFQMKYLQENKGIVILPDIVDSLIKLQQIARENGVPVKQLCEYAFKVLAEGQKESEAKSKTEI